jgi:hypothetical protein
MDASSNITFINIDIDVDVIPSIASNPLQIFDNLMLDQRIPTFDPYSISNSMGMLMNQIHHPQPLRPHVQPINPSFFYNEIDEEDDYFNEDTNTIFNMPSLAPQINRIIHGSNIQRTHGSFLNINRRNDPSPLFQNNIIEHILNNSFANDQSVYKFTLSDEGKKQLEYLKYTKETILSNDDTQYNTECPILLVEFEEGQDIIRLPCKHCFSKNAIEKWLNDKPECPVCRFKLDSIEVKKTSTTSQSTTPSATRGHASSSVDQSEIRSLLQSAILNNFEFDYDNFDMNNDNTERENNIPDIDHETEYLIATLINYFDSLDASSASLSFATTSND